MKINKKTTLDWLLAYNTKPITADELWRASWNGPINHADAGFEEKYERLAVAINDITRMFV